MGTQELFRGTGCYVPAPVPTSSLRVSEAIEVRAGKFLLLFYGVFPPTRPLEAAILNGWNDRSVLHV